MGSSRKFLARDGIVDSLDVVVPVSISIFISVSISISVAAFVDLDLLMRMLRFPQQFKFKARKM